MKLILLLLTLPPTLASAFDICGRPRSSEHPLSWESLQKRFESDLRAEKYLNVLEQLSRDFAASPRQVDAEVRTQFARRMQSVLANASTCCVDFALAQKPSADELGDDRTVLFGGEIDLSNCDGARAEQNNELRYFAEALEQVGNRMQAKARNETAKGIRTIEQDFDRFLFHGFPMLPWEALANSALLSDEHLSKGAPYNQLVLAHPSLGASIPTERFTKATPALGLAIEPVGWVHYPRSGKHARWLGISTLLFFRKGSGLGAGFSVRYNQFSGGLTWHDSNDNNRLFDNSPHFFVGLDLYQFAGERFREYSEFSQRLKDDWKSKPVSP